MSAREAALRGLAAGTLGLGALLAAAGPAAADAEDVVTRYDEHIALDADGVAHVTIDLTMDFGDSPNHGPELAYQVVARYDDTFDRVFAFSDVAASSETAPADLETEDDGDLLRLRIGDPDTEITGEHSYRVTFDVDGWVNPAGYAFPAGTLDRDELNLNVFVADHPLPMREVTVTLEAPADVLETACYAGPDGSTQACTSAAPEGSGATWTQADLPPGDGLTVVAAFPAGTFATEPILREFWSPVRAFALTPATGTVAGLVALGGAGLAVGRMRRTGRDRAWLGLTPGLEPAPGQTATEGARARGPVSVQFTPPVGLHPGQLGTLVDERADVRDVTASIVDLAVRGYLTIEAVAPEEGGWSLRKRERDWTLRRTDKPDADLVGYEQKLLGELFDGRTEVALSDLRTTFSESLSEVQTLLYEDVTARGWFAGNPRSVRGRWVAAGVLLAFLGVGLVVLVAATTHWGFAVLPLPLVGLLVAAMSHWAPARTATGSAVLAQTEGFRRYLATAEADQLRFEEGEDLFSRYLPYAIAFGLTERWTRLFEQLAAQGAALAAPSWYVGPWGHAYFWANVGSFGDDISSFTSITDAAMAAPQPGSSGGSGFSSGGGFSGGGLGGGSVGSW